MGFMNDLVKTVINTGKKAIQDEVKEQTENAIENVSKKVTSTVKGAGDAVESTVKTTIDNIGKPKEQTSTVENSAVINSQTATTMPNQPAIPTMTYTSTQPVAPQSIPSTQQTTIGRPIESNIQQPVNQGAQQNIQQPVQEYVQQNVTTTPMPESTPAPMPTQTSSNQSVAEDVANIFEKKNLMSRDEMSRTAGIFETEIIDKINQATDVLNAAYDKDTTSNDGSKSIVESVSHFLDATRNVGTSTNNELGKAINDSFKEGYNEAELKEAKETLESVTNNVQQKLEDYKNVNR